MKSLTWAVICRATLYTLSCLFVVSLAGCKASKAVKPPEAVLLTIGENKIPVSEFRYIYDKNNAGEADAYSSQSIKEYLDLFTNFKLKVYEASKLGMDTTAEFREEFAQYRKQLARPYLTDNQVTEKLIKEAYERLKEEIRASHILIEVSPTAEPEDTLAAYNKISELRKRVTSGEDFEKVAFEASEDPSAKQNRGDLGYFTALQMIYPFEDMAYRTPVGTVSPIVRTKYGYHIIKVKERRKSHGSVKVAHIMIRATEGIPKEDSIAAYNKIVEIENRLKKGESWDKLVEQFSEDLNSKNNKGELQWFSAGNMIPSFEEASFSLNNPGDISKPVQTPYGWHLIKLIEKKPLDSYENLENILRQKVSRDSRSELNRSFLLKRLKQENNFEENKKVRSLIAARADSLMIQGRWRYKAQEKDAQQVLFSINKQKYSLKQFLSYVENQQQMQEDMSQRHYINLLYNDYVDQSLLEYEEAHLEEKYRDYYFLLREYRDGILLFKIMEQNVWTKAITDNEGLQKYFENNRDKYKWNKRAKATIFNVDKRETLEKLQEELKKTYYLNDDANLGETTFSFNQSDVKGEQHNSIDRVGNYLSRDTNSIVELCGYIVKGEKGDVLDKRIKSVKEHLVEEGIAAGRIAEKKISRDRPAGSATGGGVQYLIYSRSLKVLEQRFNKNNPLTLQISEGLFQKGENKLVDEVDWKPGTYTLEKDGRIYYIVIERVEEERNKELDETRGTVVSDYQNYLEQEWIKELRKKYNVSINQPEVEKLIKK